MKIALVILHADPARGGAERYTIDLASALRARGQDVTLIASSFPVDSVPSDSVHLDVGRGTRLGKYLRFLAQLDRHLDQARYDVVHAMLPVRRCDVYHPHAGIAAESIARGHLKHDGALTRAVSRLATRINLRRMKFAAVERELLTGENPPIVLCLSEYIKKDVKAHYPLPDDRLATLFNAVDLQKFDPAARPEARQQIRERFGIQPDRVVALMIAQDFERKGLREAIASLAKVADERLVLLVVGKQNPSPYRELARSLNVAERVTFAGATGDPYAFYRSADFFVLPTRHDPCSLVVLEALAMGLPVISTVFNGACEIMTSGQHGFVLPDPRGTDALADALRKLLDANTRDAMHRACLDLRPRLSQERHVDELLRIYEGIATSRSEEKVS